MRRLRYPVGNLSPQSLVLPLAATRLRGAWLPGDGEKETTWILPSFISLDPYVRNLRKSSMSQLKTANANIYIYSQMWLKRFYASFTWFFRCAESVKETLYSHLRYAGRDTSSRDQFSSNDDYDYARTNEKI